MVALVQLVKLCIILSYSFACYAIYITNNNRLNEGIIKENSFEKLSPKFMINDEKEIIIVKRSSNDVLEKTFRNTDNTFYCNITLRIVSADYNNTVLYIRDDVSGLNFVRGTYSISNNTLLEQGALGQSEGVINVSYAISGPWTFQAQYTFTISAISEPIYKSVNITLPNGIVILSQSACISRTDFNSNLNSNLLVILFIFLGLVLSILTCIIIIFLIIRCYTGNKSVEPYETYDVYENTFLLTNNLQMNVQRYCNPSDVKSFLNVLLHDESRIMEHEIYQLDVVSAIRTDNEIKNNFKELNKTTFQIWLNNIVAKYPNLKQKAEVVKSDASKKEDEINQKYLLQIDEGIKKIMEESISKNKTNLEYLSAKQEEEKQEILKRTNATNKVKVEEILKKVYQQQRHDLIIQLKVEEDIAMEKHRLTLWQNMNDELNDLYSRSVRDFLTFGSNESTQIIPPDTSNQILKKYLEWQQKIYLITENEKIHQHARLEYNFQNRTNLAKQKDIQKKNISEALEKRYEDISSVINELIEEDDINPVTGRNILEEFRKYRETLLTEMEKAKNNQLNELLNRLNEAKKTRMNELKQQHENEISNLLSCHKTDSDIDLLSEKLMKSKEKYCADIVLKEIDDDVEGTSEILKINEDFGTQTLQKMDDKIKELTTGLRNEGMPADDIRRLLESFQRNTKKLKDFQNTEKEKQIRAMERKLHNSLKEIDKNREKQLEKQKKRFESDNNIIDDLLVIQKTLSNNDRENILKEFTKNKLSTQNSIANSYLEQRRKMEEALANKKANEIKRIEEIHSEKIQGMVDNKMRSKTRKTESELRAECETALILDYLNNKVHIFDVAEWRNDIQIEIEAIRNELLTERASLLSKKEEETVTMMIQIQMQKSKESVELEEQKKKILNIQLAAVESSGTNPSCQEVFKSYQRTKSNVQDEIEKARILQEMKLKKRLENQKRGSLLAKKSEEQQKQTMTSDANQNEQSLEDEFLENEKKKQLTLQDVEKDLMKKFIAAGSYSRDDILNLMIDIYPLKSNQEIEKVVEEVYPISRQKNQQSLPKSEVSLLDAYRKYKEKNKGILNQQSIDSIDSKRSFGASTSSSKKRLLNEFEKENKIYEPDNFNIRSNKPISNDISMKGSRPLLNDFKAKSKNEEPEDFSERMEIKPRKRDSNIIANLSSRPSAKDFEIDNKTNEPENFEENMEIKPRKRKKKIRLRHTTEPEEIDDENI